MPNDGLLDVMYAMDLSQDKVSAKIERMIASCNLHLLHAVCCLVSHELHSIDTSGSSAFTLGDEEHIKHEYMVHCSRLLPSYLPNIEV